MGLVQAVSLTRMRVVTQCRQGIVGEAAPPCGQFTGAGSDRASRAAAPPCGSSLDMVVRLGPWRNLFL